MPHYMAFTGFMLRDSRKGLEIIRVYLIGNMHVVISGWTGFQTRPNFFEWKKFGQNMTLSKEDSESVSSITTYEYAGACFRRQCEIILELNAKIGLEVTHNCTADVRSYGIKVSARPLVVTATMRSA